MGKGGTYGTGIPGLDPNAPKVGDQKVENGILYEYSSQGGGRGAVTYFWKAVGQVTPTADGGTTVVEYGSAKANEAAGANQDQFGNLLAPANGVLDPVEKAKQADILDTSLESARTRSWMASSMHRGYRSSFLIGPRGLEGGAWLQSTIDAARFVDGQTVQGNVDALAGLDPSQWGALAPAPLPNPVAPSNNPLAPSQQPSERTYRPRYYGGTNNKFDEPLHAL